ncbi:HK97 gp10 family phage protein [Paenibacillus alvei]|uniref:HK97-gp10 family putative phage morphogenesis protein n=1 Tax=Paenibacillus alvei TaxID=44250 RepID=UPI0002880117|nr:HK97-gp10 family putative phage morphogenesis protein [Paenibacillus alvei]EJW14221.1 putative phage protein [Paenibacillus alvei DSM 29]MCY9544684.1 HK97 gp10 family phage protein [Paenibacillus alvei]MCY9708227.1 HK97 gp10 family phage protein [Paenibacillus alvei]MCY9738214.1 HK97 gp10 family phage protein [Paenibacillus alvei]MCY9758679.1 HK97 gp10 family phage protein [Paenibacillus alvei]
MSKGRVELQGINEMLQAIRSRLGAGAARLENKALQEGGEIIAEAQREKVAVSDRASLHMRDDIKVSRVRRQDGVKFVLIGPGKETGWRAHFLEFGTKKTPAQPFIYPAFHEQKAAVEQHMIREFQRGVRDG